MENSSNQNNPSSGTDPKTVAIISYITIFGWIIALILNKPKSEFATFHLRQMLGLLLFALVGSFIPFVNVIVGLFVLVLWVMGLLSAVQGEMKPVPFVGDKFQEWFRSL